jgi:hypothetical protein
MASDMWCSIQQLNIILYYKIISLTTGPMKEICLLLFSIYTGINSRIRWAEHEWGRRMYIVCWWEGQKERDH